MNGYIATITELPGHISLLAEDQHEAAQLLQDWADVRLGRVPSFQIHGIDAASSRDQSELRPLADAGFRGVAYWTPEVPPQIEAPGPAYRAPERVHAFEFSGFREGGRLIAFASTRDDAWAVYRLWAERHDRQDQKVNRLARLYPGTGVLRSDRLVRAMVLGVIGVAAKRMNGWDVVPPWDEAAGNGQLSRGGRTGLRLPMLG